MLRILFCMSCCSVPPASRPGKRKSSSNPNLQKKAELSKSQSALAATRNDSPDKSQPEDTKTRFVTLAASEKDQLLANQVQVNSENYGTKAGGAQGKLNLEIDSAATAEPAGPTVARAGAQLELREDDNSLAASISIKSQQANFNDSSERQAIDRYSDLKLDEESASPSAGSSNDDIRPYRESRRDSAANPWSAEPAGGSREAPQQAIGVNAGGQKQQQPQQVAALTSAASTSAARNVPSTTKIGDYARIEYSPVEDLDSVTTMSYSRLGSERGAGGRSQADSTLSRQNSLGRATEPSLSRRSSQGGVESTSLSIASQLSNEQFQQNLTNMLESVNPNYPTFGTIGLPLGPPIEAPFQTETTKTSPETPGAALTSASQDSLSDGSFTGDINRADLASRPATLRSDQSTGGALVNDSFQQERLNMEEMAELAKPAPLAMGEDENVAPQQQQPPPLPLGLVANDGERVGSPQSFTTTTSTGALTNPTPTPSEMSGGSGKKKRLRAKSLFKKLKPSGKKKNKDEVSAGTK